MAAIASARPVSPAEYIARFVNGGEKPICEYLDGELSPKPMPTKEHSQVQANVIFEIRRNYGGQFEALPELTTRLRETKFYVPDIAVEDLTHPMEGRYPGPGNPIFLCIEIKSLEDRVGKLFSKCEEYHAWGVPYCWVIDPERKVTWEYRLDDPEPRKADRILAAGSIQIPLVDLFRRL